MKNFGLQAEFGRQMLRIREITTARDEELQGGWYTEERMQQELKYSKPLASNQLPGFSFQKMFFRTVSEKKSWDFKVL